MQAKFGCSPQAIVFAIFLLGVGCTSAPTREEANVSEVKVDATLALLQQKVKGSTTLIQKAKGVLVFPGVLEGAFWGGAEYGGNGALRIGGKTVDYYNIMALSIGAQFGVQQKDIVFLFMDKNALQEFRNSAGWKVGLDGKVTLITVGAEDSFSSQTYNKPILAFVIDGKGLMAGVSLEGAKITKRDSMIGSSSR